MKGLTIKYMNLEVGQITDATITGIKKYGIFLNINNNIAFCHISNISGKFINDITTLYNINDNIKVKVINIKNDGKIEVSIKDAIDNEHLKHQNNFIKDKQYFNNKSSKTNIKKESESFEDMLQAFMKNSESKFKDIDLRNQKRKH